MATAVLLHPHPDMGGNQDNNVVVALRDALEAAGVATRRFDFGSADVAAAQARTIAEIEAAEAPVFLIGYSFGGGIAASIDHPALAGWGLVAPALRLAEPVIGADPRPKHVVAAEHDAWFSPEALAETTDDWVATTHGAVPDTDHFFAGAAAEAAAEQIAAFVLARLDG